LINKKWPVVTGQGSAAVIVIAAVIGVAVYLGWARVTGVWGFALDDAWIHQTYARNLATTGQFEFVPGQPSSGSTSGTWTLLVALGYLARVNFKWWTYALGLLCLAMTALGVWALTSLLFPERSRAALAAGIFCALEWHLIWSAVSGMETVLFTALSLWLMVEINLPNFKTQNQGDDLLIGIWCGVLVLTRPEGLLLVGLVMLAQVRLRGWARRTTWARLVWTVIGIAIPMVPWIAFNWLTSGTPFPNTFYAKQREYAESLATISFSERFAQVFAQPLVGAQVVLLPGFVSAVWPLMRRIRKPETWPRLVPPVWAIAHLATYALRLPVIYQHGRYEIPAIPVLIVFGLGGTAALLHLSDTRLWARVLSRALALSIAITLLAFVVVGARAYATDVSIIEGEMVRVARWLDANATPGDLIAAHDIGAIGYFTRRPLLDLAGLVSPEVIPFIRDEARLGSLMRQRGAAYLVTFPSWYPRLTSQLEPVFSGSATQITEHLTVYRLP
jgi:arabinofuranosyltransferase